MLTQEQVLSAIKAGRESKCLDGRDYSRLTDFFPADQWEHLGFKLKEGAELAPVPAPWTRETVIERLKSDVEFGIEKARSQRGISAALMFEVVRMWLWILEDDLQYRDHYDNYGLEFQREVHRKYFGEVPL